MDPLISIIVPVYNVEKYLPRCLDSLACQTLKEIEIILVDDGSTDNSGDLCDRYAEKDPRFHVIHQESAGLSAARNRGIEASRADWLMFVDSDDWVEPRFCELPLRAAIQHSADLILFRYRIDQGNGLHLKGSARSAVSEGSKTKKEAMSLIHRFVSSLAWNKLYKKDLFQSIRYPVGKKYEDIGTTYRLVHTASSVFYLPVSLYNYEKRPHSITTSRSSASLDDRFEMISREFSDLVSWGYISPLHPEHIHRLYVMCLIYLIHLGPAGKYSEVCSATLKRIPLQNNTFSSHQNTALLLFRFCPVVFNLLCRLTGKRYALSDM